MSKDATILFCRCSYPQVIPQDTSSRLLGALESSDRDFHIISDLCFAAARQPDQLKDLVENKSIKILACFPRAVKSLLGWAGINTDDVEFYNMRTTPPEELINSIFGIDENTQPVAAISKPHDWISWFPVIDRDLCTNCKQCLDFCLFGVYSLVDDKVAVTNPSACKTNCPACAKVCPKAAIIFPKYQQSPINGDKVDAETVKAVNLKALMDGDLQEKLRQRTKKRRFAPDTTDEDKKQRLKDLQHQLDIPQDVIDSLSPGDCPNSDFCDKDCQKENDID